MKNDIAVATQTGPTAKSPEGKTALQTQASTAPTQLPLTSLLIPCCGQLEYTKLCVPSVLRWTKRPFELIFLDIGSLDGTAEYLAGVAAAAHQLRVEIVRAPTDLGGKREKGTA